MRRELLCTEAATPPRLAVRSVDAAPARPRTRCWCECRPRSVNPIDVKRAAGYGRRLLGLKGAARFPLVLGNDVAGIVEAIGAGVTRCARATRVRPGRHRPRRWRACVARRRAAGPLAARPGEADPTALAVLPYSFTTMWLALRSTGITAVERAGVPAC